MRRPSARRWSWLVAYVALTAAGVVSITTQPPFLAQSLGPVIFAWGSTLAVGGILATYGRLRGFWRLEAAGHPLIIVALVAYGSAALATSQGAPSRMPLGLCFLAFASFAYGHMREVQEPGRKA